MARDFDSPHSSHKAMDLAHQIGAQAKVERVEVRTEDSERANADLRKMGDKLNPKPDALKYVGSAAFHVYLAEATHFVFAISQVQTMQDCPMPVANIAQQNFHSDLTHFYTGKRRKKRSGF